MQSTISNRATKISGQKRWQLPGFDWL